MRRGILSFAGSYSRWLVAAAVAVVALASIVVMTVDINWYLGGVWHKVVVVAPGSGTSISSFGPRRMPDGASISFRISSGSSGPGRRMVLMPLRVGRLNLGMQIRIVSATDQVTHQFNVSRWATLPIDFDPGEGVQFRVVEGGPAWSEGVAG